MFLDEVFTQYPSLITELKLNSTFLTAPECLVIAGNESLKELKTLDLSCNPLTALGLVNLVHPRRSLFKNLQQLTLFNCEIDATQAYLITNEIQECRVNFNLRHLNLSHNKLSFLLNYVIELGLINNDLTKLLLYKCELDDEQVLKLADCKRVEGLQSIDVGDNLLDVNFTLIARVLKE